MKIISNWYGRHLILYNDNGLVNRNLLLLSEHSFIKFNQIEVLIWSRKSRDSSMIFKDLLDFSYSGNKNIFGRQKNFFLYVFSVDFTEKSLVLIYSCQDIQKKAWTMKNNKLFKNTFIMQYQIIDKIVTNNCSNCLTRIC